MTIEEGFRHLTSQEGWYRKCTNNNEPLNPSTARVFKMKFNTGRLSQAKMIELLRSAGYKITPPTCELPDDK